MPTTLATQTASSIRKAAILLITLGEEASAELMQQLSPHEVKRLCDETASIREISGEQTETVLREFYQITNDSKANYRGGPEFTQRVLSRALGAESAKKLLTQAPDAMVEGFAKLEPLVKSDPAQVARSLNNEHPQTIALIVSHLPPEQAVSLMLALPEQIRGEVALRMARLDQIAPDVVKQIAEAVGERFSNQETIDRRDYGGVRIVAELCNRLDPDISQDILQSISDASPETADRIRKIMFVFEDVLQLDDMAMTEVNGRVDRKTLVMAMKGTSEQIKEHFTKKMSSRAREMILEDLDALGPVRVRDVESAQDEIIAIVRQLEQEGAISRRSSSGKTGGDGYVV